MNVLFRLWYRIQRHDHVPRLWPITLVDVDTRKTHYEPGTFDVQLKRVRSQ